MKHKITSPLLPVMKSNFRRVCRKCGGELDRIPRSIFMKTFFSWLNLKKYYCYGCLGARWRFHKKSRKNRDDDASPVVLTIEHE